MLKTTVHRKTCTLKGERIKWKVKNFGFLLNINIFDQIVFITKAALRMQTCREKCRNTKRRESALDAEYKRKTFCIFGVSAMDSKKPQMAKNNILY